jgi:hypothetical protein
MSTIEVRLLTINSHPEPVTFVLEPWGKTYPLGTGEQISLVARGPEGGYPEVDCADGEITVWTWPGSAVRIFKDDEELGGSPAKRPPFPENALPPIKQPNWG